MSKKRVYDIRSAGTFETRCEVEAPSEEYAINEMIDIVKQVAQDVELHEWEIISTWEE